MVGAASFYGGALIAISVRTCLRVSVHVSICVCVCVYVHRQRGKWEITWSSSRLSLYACLSLYRALYLYIICVQCVHVRKGSGAVEDGSGECGWCPGSRGG